MADDFCFEDYIKNSPKSSACPPGSARTRRYKSSKSNSTSTASTVHMKRRAASCSTFGDSRSNERLGNFHLRRGRGDHCNRPGRLGGRTSDQQVQFLADVNQHGGLTTSQVFTVKDGSGMTLGDAVCIAMALSPSSLKTGQQNGAGWGTRHPGERESDRTKGVSGRARSPKPWPPPKPRRQTSP